MKKSLIAQLSSALAVLMLLVPSNADAQVKGKLKQENENLKNQVENLKKQVTDLKKESKPQPAPETPQAKPKQATVGIKPGEYNAEVTDSLLNIWYLHRQIGPSNPADMYDIDSVHFTSKVSDAVLKQRLENLNSFITLPYNEVVRNYMVLYSEKMPSRMCNILSLCQYYMPIFEETFNKYGLPEELKYVAIIESALNPKAISRAGAAGMWQFMYHTAKSYGLEINSYVDERFDPYKSADAAARYMEDSYNLFGDWDLAISSYNCGPGNVNKAIRRCGSRAYWDVYNYLPRETRGYVPAFVGAMYAIKYSKEYGLQPNGVQMPVEVDTFQIHKNLAFKQISELVGIPVEKLRQLNPQYIKDIIPGSSKTYILRIPYNYTPEFISHEDSLYTYKADQYLNAQTVVPSDKTSTVSSDGKTIITYVQPEKIAYKVKKGDSLGKIASKYHTTVSQLQKWNHLRSTNINVGQTIYIYKNNGKPIAVKTVVPADKTSTSGKGTAAAADTSNAAKTVTGPASQAQSDTVAAIPAKTAATKTSTAPKSSSQTYTIYTVRKGDSLSKIASHYGVSIKSIQKANGIGERINAGQRLKIPKK